MPKRTKDQVKDKKVTEETVEFPLQEINENKEDVSDSEESVYSGLEEEEDSSDDEDVESINNDDDTDESDDADDESEENEDPEVDDSGSEEESDKEDDISIQQVVDVPVVTRVDPIPPRHQPVFEDVDTSDEEDIRNTVGNIPMEWYDEYQHFGYDLLGNKLTKGKQGDQLDNFLEKMENPDYWRTVYDKKNMEEMKLSQEEVDIIERIQNGKYGEAGFDPYEPYVDWFTGEKMVHPIKDNPLSKRSFIPSKWEHKKVIKIVRAIRNGWIKPKTDQDGKPKYYLLWGKDDSAKKHPMHWPAPKLKLPGHEESYNPPPEYLPSEAERLAWETADPEDRTQNFLSKKIDSLRKVPGYSKFIEERFERCLDLYLCPRQQKVRLDINPEDLIPKLPRPKDLQPFPTVESLRFTGHDGIVSCISVSPDGQWLASGSSDKTIRFWEVSTGRCVKKIECEGVVHCIEWNPQEALPIIAAAVESTLLVINPWLGDKLLCKNVDNTVCNTDTISAGDNVELVKWSVGDKTEKTNGLRLKIEHKKAIKQVSWHIKGDYLSAVLPEGENKSVIIHQLSKRSSQCPFKKSKGQIQCVKFHPTRPFFFVATQRYVRVYNLQKQELTKKLMSGVKWISCIDVHPKGDNLIIGSYDKRLCWFDMDLSTKPYKTLRHHKRALRQVCYHKRYPLFASCSDDGNVIVCHGTVYSDLMQNPMIVPLKILRGHKTVDDIGVVDCTFHPQQPWIFTCGADKTIRLFT